MNRNLRSLVVVLSLALGTFSVTFAQAADPSPTPATGSISGRVLDENGKPIAGIRVAALRPGTLVERRARAGGAGTSTAPAPGDRKPLEPLARTVTAADGTFTLTNVPVGKVRVIAGLKGDGLGLVRELVTVKVNQTTPVGDIELHKPAATRPRPGTTLVK